MTTAMRIDRRLPYFFVQNPASVLGLRVHASENQHAFLRVTLKYATGQMLRQDVQIDDRSYFLDLSEARMPAEHLGYGIPSVGATQPPKSITLEYISRASDEGSSVEVEELAASVN